jgi:hypothetical protein
VSYYGATSKYFQKHIGRACRYAVLRRMALRGPGSRSTAVDRGWGKDCYRVLMQIIGGRALL